MTTGFSPEALKGLRKLLRNSVQSDVAEDIIAELQHAIAACPTQDEFRQRIVPLWREHLHQLQALSDALHTARCELDTHDPDHRIAFLDDMERLALHVDTRISWMETWVDYSGSGKRQRPRNEPRWWLANVVAYSLQWHGIRLTKTHNIGRNAATRGGTLYKVLIQVIETAEGKTPDDRNVADLIDATVDLFRMQIHEGLEDAVDFGFVGLMRASSMVKPVRRRRRRQTPRRPNPSSE